MRWMTLALGLIFCSGLAACGSDDDGTPVNGVCKRSDGNGVFCIQYTGVPSGNVSDVDTGCANDWGGVWTEAGSCDPGVPVGTCTLDVGVSGGATTAIMTIYEPTDPQSAKDDICAGSGTWAPS